MNITKRTRAILQALLVTLIWSSSWILIKNTLSDIPPLTFAGLRYSLATIFLLPGLIKHKDGIRSIKPNTWMTLFLLGIFFYALTQGGQFLTLNHLETTTLSLLLNFSSIFIALLGIIFLNERPSRMQWFGMMVFLAGVFLYFSPNPLASGNVVGFLLAGMTVLANAIAGMLGRKVNLEKSIPPSVVTGISMGIGALILMTAGLLLEEFPVLSLQNWMTIVVLASVNTAFAFTLWNRSLQVLTAVESGIINNAMLVQIALLSWIFLDAQLTWLDWAALLIATAGMVLVSIQPTRSKKKVD